LNNKIENKNHIKKVKKTQICFLKNILLKNKVGKKDIKKILLYDKKN
jgi:hypothetical protein